MAHSERLAAIEALYVGQPATLTLLSKATGRSLKALERTAKKENWERTKKQNAPEKNEQKARLLLSRIGRIVDEKLHNETVDKRDIDEVLNLLRLVEKLGGIIDKNTKTLQENTSEITSRSIVAETTETTRILLQKMDQRIEQLAQYRAEFLLNEGAQKTSRAT